MNGLVAALVLGNLVLSGLALLRLRQLSAQVAVLTIRTTDLVEQVIVAVEATEETTEETPTPR